MKKKIAILGSTGSIGKTLLEIIHKNKKNFDIKLLTARENYKVLLKQANIFNVKNVILTDKKNFELHKSKFKKKKIKIYNDYSCFKRIFNKRLDYVMSSIVGLEGLHANNKIIKYTKTIAIANKETIICGWDLINKQLKKTQTNFIPVDSEHFSLWYGLNNLNQKSIEKIYLTASGGPLYKLNLNNLNKVTINQAIRHPNWKMGKKISVDSATLINKVYEVIESKNIFNIPYDKIKILMHPKSYIHAFIKFNNGLIKIIAHDTTMKIPIFNTLYLNSNRKLSSKDLNIKILNNLKLKNVDIKKFPMVKLLKYLPLKNSLYETVIVSANDTLVELFLKKKIKYIEIQKNLFKLLKSKEFLKYKKIYPKNTNDIIELNKYVRLKLLEKVYKSVLN